jgi:hypothetical protein
VDGSKLFVQSSLVVVVLALALALALALEALLVNVPRLAAHTTSALEQHRRHESHRQRIPGTPVNFRMP